MKNQLYKKIIATTFIPMFLVIFLNQCSYSVGILTHSNKNCDCQVTAQASWKQSNKLLENAQIQLVNAKEKAYLVVLSETKDQFPSWDLQKYSDVTRNKLIGFVNGQEMGNKESITINGLQALQYKILGKKGDQEVIYIHTAIAGKDRFFQVLMWTPKSRLSQNKKNMMDLLMTFKETS